MQNGQLPMGNLNFTDQHHVIVSKMCLTFINCLWIFQEYIHNSVLDWEWKFGADKLQQHHSQFCKNQSQGKVPFKFAVQQLLFIFHFYLQNLRLQLMGSNQKTVQVFWICKCLVWPWNWRRISDLLRTQTLKTTCASYYWATFIFKSVIKFMVQRHISGGKLCCV
jgi:hypothetical protein